MMSWKRKLNRISMLIKGNMCKQKLQLHPLRTRQKLNMMMEYRESNKNKLNSRKIGKKKNLIDRLKWVKITKKTRIMSQTFTKFSIKIWNRNYNQTMILFRKLLRLIKRCHLSKHHKNLNLNRNIPMLNWNQIFC